MIKFNYKGKSSDGKNVEGEIQADSRKQAIQLLKLKNFQIDILREIIHGKSSKISEKKIESKPSESKVIKKNSIKLGANRKLALEFLKRLLQLHASGIPIGDAIKILQQRVSDSQHKIIATSLWKDLSEGMSLTNAMRRFPKIFTDSIIYPIEAGEATGNLGPIIKDIVDYLESQEEMKKQILSGLSYPIFVCTVAFGVVGLFLFFLLPRIQGMMSSMGGKMNWSAELLIGSANFLFKFGPFIAIGLFVGLIFLLRWKKTKAGAYVLDRLILRMPFIGNIVWQIDICQVSNLMNTLLNSGINLTEAMKLIEKSIHNSLLRSHFQNARIRINDGLAFSLSFKSVGKFFTDIALDIISVGEMTGNLSKSFTEIYSIYKGELDKAFKKLTNLISGIALGFAFALVGILALSIVMSIMQFSNTLVAH